MRLNTASAVISFIRKLEEDGARLYTRLSGQSTGDGEALLALAGENQKNIVQVERAYYGVISDAIEGTFAFDIDTEEYDLDDDPHDDVSYGDGLKRALVQEEKTRRFYLDAAEQSRSLLADVPRVFTLIARKRSGRAAKLTELIEKAG